MGKLAYDKYRSSSNLIEAVGSITSTNNISVSIPTPNLESLTIPYQDNQPADLELQDGNFASISIFGVNTYIKGDVQNIMYSLNRIVKFIS